MSLRSRLTLLYSSLTGGILLLFGVLTFLLVSYVLDYQSNNLLKETVHNLIYNARINQIGDVSFVTVPSLEFTSGVYIQLWNREGVLKSASPGISMMTDPLDPDGISVSSTLLNDVYIDKIHLKVISVPLELTDGHKVGVIQAATPLALTDTIRRILLYSLSGITLVSMLLAASTSWLALGQALAPLKTATETADQITHADDLSRRIPYNGPDEDEIGMLIGAFNSTLERLESLFTTQQRFLADVSHELRTPLTVIKGNADLIRKFGPDDESLNSIKDEADRLSRLVGDLLLLAKAESGKLQLTLAPVEFDSLFFEVMNEMRVLAGDKVTLKLTNVDQVLVIGDRDRLKQVLINLISNAIQYTPKGGEVTLNMGKTSEQAWFSVRDTGPGIPKDDLPFIFDRFYRGEKSRTRSKATGFGLGLSIAYWIANNHGGHIEVVSVVGEGTIFTLWLPAQETQTLPDLGSDND